MTASSILRTCLMILSALALVAGAVLIGKFFGADPAQNGRPDTFYQQYVIAGGPIVWCILIPMSVVTVYLAIEHSFTIRRGRLTPPDATDTVRRLLTLHGAETLDARLNARCDLVSVAVRHALTKSGGDRLKMKTLINDSLQDQAMLLLRKIEWVNLIGNVAPMVGLFGTVVGMIQLFNAIVVSGGQPQPAQLAGGISVALVTTFWGLLIAIPALAIHGVFRNRIETLVSDAVVEAERVIPHLTARPRTADNLPHPSAAKVPQIREVAPKKPESADSKISQV